MRNKGAIRLLAITLALVSLYQLSFTFVTFRIEKKANDYAQGDPQKKTFYKDSIAGVPVYNFLGLKKYTYRDCQEREFNLGLDLKGGMNVTLEVSVENLIRSLANHSKDTTFNKALLLARQMQKTSQTDFVTLFGQAFQTVDPNGRLAAIFNTMELRDQISYNSTNDEVLSVLSKETNAAIQNSIKILRARIDQFGVAQPSFQELGTAGRVLIELPGIKEPERVRKLLQVAAKLEFWETYENPELAQFFQDANARLKEINQGLKQTTDSIAQSKDQTKPQKDTTLAKSDTTRQSLLDKLEKDTTAANKSSDLEQFAENYPLWALLKPNSNGTQFFPGSIVGFAHFRDTARVNTILNMPRIRSIFPSNVRFYWSAKPLPNNPETFALHAIKVTSRDGKAALDGSVVQRARQDYDMSGKPEVTLLMNAEGARTWQRLTKDNVGRSIAIVLDGYVRSSPTVQGEISGGRSSISGGNMTVEEAQDLANILNVGKMDAPAVIVQESVVGPSLGHESINSGLISFLIAFLIVLVYMVFYYNKAGFVSDVALLVNVFLIMGVLASLGAVLTLPGIAGIILTIGMSVDA
ncbi:MAG: protein translocase subunit SecDF, partial [Bacteroidales bacterium]|nr:protein translocase subunit SecDF [Bacteroidales bacterium]